MKSRPALMVAVLLLSSPVTGQYKRAAPGYKYEFPRDHFHHQDFQTEWWYYTGNLTASDGHRFGYELTFFRHGVDRSSESAGTWYIEDIYLAHLALSDIDGGKFYHSERTNRAGPGIAGVSETEQRIWNGNWSATWREGRQQLQAGEDRFTVSLLLDPEKPVVIHGENGISQKSAGAGHSSHYISLTRLKTKGRIELAGLKYTVAGAAWMDHEFFTEQLAPDQAGWDWVGVQLNDNTELMLYRMRKKDGSVDPFSSGTFIDKQGHPAHLCSTDFSMTPDGEPWRSPETGAAYPIEWRLTVPKLGLQLTAKTRLKSQEFTSRSGVVPSYWEGAMEFRGARGGMQVEGLGYLEMTSYDRSVVLGINGAGNFTR